MSFKDSLKLKKRLENYEKGLDDAKEDAFQKLVANATALQANAIVGIKVDVENFGANGYYTMISIVGTAVLVG